MSVNLVPEDALPKSFYLEAEVARDRGLGGCEPDRPGGSQDNALMTPEDTGGALTKSAPSPQVMEILACFESRAGSGASMRRDEAVQPRGI